MKRLFDFVAAGAGLLVLSPVMLVAALLIKSDTPGPVFFRQERIGKNFRPFRIFKFRTMVQNAAAIGSSITFGEDPRITRVGRVLRRIKFDELPQLINVLKGEMSLVGPRPEVRSYVELYRKDYEEILEVRPGITDIASLKYRNESSLLAVAEDPEKEYMSRVLPDKIALAKEYVKCSSFFFDVMLIVKTIARLFETEKPFSLVSREKR